VARQEALLLPRLDDSVGVVGEPYLEIASRWPTQTCGIFVCSGCARSFASPTRLPSIVLRRIAAHRSQRLFVSQRDHGIDSQGTARGDV
jgi:hypothetical protein